MNIHNVDLTCPIKEPKYFSLKVIWGNHGIWVVAYGSYHTANLTVFETKVVLLFTRQWRAGVSHFGVHSVIETHRKNNFWAASLFVVPIIEKSSWNGNWTICYKSTIVSKPDPDAPEPEKSSGNSTPFSLESKKGDVCKRQSRDFHHLYLITGPLEYSTYILW